jgi:putative endonuclease
MKYFAYILECSDKTLYCGWTNDLDKRILAHNTLKSGAKYTRGRRPVILVYVESFKTQNQAMSREVCIKNMTRKRKLDIIRLSSHNYTS